MGRVPVGGVWIDDLSAPEILTRIESFLLQGGPHQIVTANPLMILSARKDEKLGAAFRSADLVIADSVGVVLAARGRGRRLTKISGIDLLETLCARAAQGAWRVFLMGASPGVAEKAAEVLGARHPGLVVVGTHHGYFDRAAPGELIRRIAAAQADLLFVALATPFQDGWIHEHLKDLGAKVVVGVGGSFDVLSGRLRRAPPWMRAIGLEWFFRLLQEPSRWPRMLRLFLFPLICLKSSWKKTPTP